jgi:hypothetical protein
MDGACSTYGRDEKMHIKFWSGNWKGKDHLEEVGMGGRIIIE